LNAVRYTHLSLFDDEELSLSLAATGRYIATMKNKGLTITSSREQGENFERIMGALAEGGMCMVPGSEDFEELACGFVEHLFEVKEKAAHLH
jgi:hypothetical protein